MDENYHKDHLACHNCPCYQELYANCEECKKPIGPDYKRCSPPLSSSSLEEEEEEEEEEEQYFDACSSEDMSKKKEHDKLLQNELVNGVELEPKDGKSQKSKTADNITLRCSPPLSSSSLEEEEEEEEEEEQYFDACSSEDMSKKKEHDKLLQNELVNGVELEPKDGKSQKSKTADNITLLEEDNKWSVFYDLEEDNEWSEFYDIFSDARRKEDDVFKRISLNFKPILFEGVSFCSARLIKSSLALFCLHLPCAGGTGLEYGQHKQKAVSDIYENTLNPTSHCPNASEYIQRASAKCADVCENGSCSYHCMRNSYKTSLVEFCAKSKILFDYCPEYDPIGRTIQKDVLTPCNSSDSIKKFYKSSDIFFCDPNSCLQLRKGSASTFVTGMVMTTTTPISGDMKKTRITQNLLPLVLLSFPLIISYGVWAYIMMSPKNKQKECKKEENKLKTLI